MNWSQVKTGLLASGLVCTTLFLLLPLLFFAALLWPELAATPLMPIWTGLGCTGTVLLCSALGLHFAEGREG